MFKNVIYLVSVILLISFNSCSEEEVIVKDEAKGDIFNNSMYSLEVDDNTLVFESEETFNTFLDYLNEVGDDNFDKVEKEIGFMSLRRSENKPDGYSKIEDPLIATLLNPECEIVIAGYKFHLNLENETTKVTNFGDNIYKSQNIQIDEPLVLGWEDNFFEMEEQGNLKGWINWDYCRTSKEKIKNWHWERLNAPGLGVDLKAKICFQRFTFINTIIIKFKCMEYYDTVEWHVGMEANTYEYQMKGENYPTKENDFEMTSTFVGNGNEISERPFWGTTRVSYFDVDFNFFVTDPIQESVRLSIYCDKT